MNLTTKTLSALAGLALVTGSAQAATVLFQFDDGDIPFANNLGTGSAVTSNGFAGVGVTVSNWTATSPVREIGIAGGQVRAKKSGDTDIHTFSITIPDTVVINLNSLSFDYGNVGPDTSPANFLVSTDAGGSFSNNPATHGSGTFSGTANMGITGLTGLTDTTLTFTFADSAGGNNRNTTMYTFIDNVTLNGEVAPVPEPATGLMALVGLGVMATRRRRG